MSNKKARVIALYLPQYHPIPENDEWWGKGFTEWTNVGRAKPLFKGHYQPRVPADLGYYDLRVPEVRDQQAELAKEAGVEGFCYYHYYFGNGRTLLQRPLRDMLASKSPNFPFCLCWANHTWSNKTWEKSSSLSKETVLMEQTYGGEKDYTEHFYSLLDAFKDPRYMKVDGKLLFVIYDILVNFPEPQIFIKIWRRLAEENGLPGFHFVAMMPATVSYRIAEDGHHIPATPNLKSSEELFNYALKQGFDAVNSFGKRRGEILSRGMLRNYIDKLMGYMGLRSVKYDYLKTVNNFFAPEDTLENVYPTILPQWDRTARVGKADGVYVNSSPKNFGLHVRKALNLLKGKSEEHKILFIKSWNEWAEGNYMEPDLKYGHGYIQALHDALTEYNS